MRVNKIDSLFLISNILLHVIYYAFKNPLIIKSENVFIGLILLQNAVAEYL